MTENLINTVISKGIAMFRLLHRSPAYHQKKPNLHVGRRYLRNEAQNIITTGFLFVTGVTVGGGIATGYSAHMWSHSEETAFMKALKMAAIIPSGMILGVFTSAFIGDLFLTPRSPRGNAMIAISGLGLISAITTYKLMPPSGKAKE